MRQRMITTLTVLMLLAAACGGGDDTSDPTNAAAGTEASTTTAASNSAAADDTTTTTAADTTTTTMAPVAAGNDNQFCRTAEETEALSDFDIFADDLEAEMQKFLDEIETARDNAPDEIRDDVAVLAAAFRDFFDLLADYEFNMFAIDPDDERFAAFEAQTDALDEASRNIAAYCGIDIDETLDDPADSGTDDGLSTELPEDFPEELIPPGFTEVYVNLGGSIVLGSDGDLEEVTSFYEDALGASRLGTAADGFLLMGSSGGAEWTIIVADDDTDQATTLVTLTSFG